MYVWCLADCRYIDNFTPYKTIQRFCGHRFFFAMNEIRQFEINFKHSLNSGPKELKSTIPESLRKIEIKATMNQNYHSLIHIYDSYIAPHSHPKSLIQILRISESFKLIKVQSRQIQNFGKKSYSQHSAFSLFF